MAAALARFVNRYAVGVVGIWLLLAAAANIAVPQLEHVMHEHSRAFFPPDAASGVAAVRMGQVFGDSDTNNLAYLALASNHPLGAAERAYYDRAVAELRADTVHVASVMDLWSQPLTAQMAESADHRAVYILLRLTGQIGSAEATKSIASVRALVSKLPRPDGLQTYITGPGATIVDSFDELDRQLLKITALTVVVIALLLFLVYRSVITTAIPLMTVGLSLAITRPLVAALADHGVVEVSIFSVTLMSAMVLGAGTDYGIFLLGRYHENRRNGLDADSALIGAYRSVAPIIVASSLTIAAALFCLILSKVGILRSAGIPCSIGILVTMVASLTLLPALIRPGISARTRRTSHLKHAAALAADRHRGGKVAGPAAHRRRRHPAGLRAAAAGYPVELRRTGLPQRHYRIQPRLSRDGPALPAQSPDARDRPDPKRPRSAQSGRPDRHRTGHPTYHGPPRRAISPVRQSTGRNTAHRGEPEPSGRPHRQPVGAEHEFPFTEA